MNETIEMRWVNRITFQNGERVSTPTLQYRELETHHGVGGSVKLLPYEFNHWSSWRDVPVTNEEVY